MAKDLSKEYFSMALKDHRGMHLGLAFPHNYRVLDAKRLSTTIPNSERRTPNSVDD
jgi:hypothetical protein